MTCRYQKRLRTGSKPMHLVTQYPEWSVATYSERLGTGTAGRYREVWNSTCQLAAIPPKLPTSKSCRQARTVAWRLGVVPTYCLFSKLEEDLSSGSRSLRELQRRSDS